jgi:DNA-directed RNA polymerase subunit RPC12/RpoP
MAVYVYDLVCLKCRHVFEVVADGPVAERENRCPECGSEDLHQKVLNYFHNGRWSPAECGSPRGSGFG